MRTKTRSGRSKSTNTDPVLKIDQSNMEANNNKPKTGDSDPEDLNDLSDEGDQDDQSLLKKIIKKQKNSDKTIEKRFSKLDAWLDITIDWILFQISSRDGYEAKRIARKIKIMTVGMRQK